MCCPSINNEIKYYNNKNFSLKYETVMAAFWATHFHKSDAEETSRKSIDGIKDVIAQMRVVLGNVDTEHTIVHDVEALKTTRDKVKKSIESIREDVARVRKMKGPRGERGNGWFSGAHAPSREVETTGRTGDFYLDTSTLTAYKKLASGWHAFATLQGPKGQPGQQGPPGNTGQQGQRGIQGERGEQGESSEAFRFYGLEAGIFRRSYRYPDISIRAQTGVTRLSLHGMVFKQNPRFSSTGFGIFKLFTSTNSDLLTVPLSSQSQAYSFSQSTALSTLDFAPLGYTMVIHILLETVLPDGESDPSPLAVKTVGITVEHGNAATQT